MGPDWGNMGGVPKLQCFFLQETDEYSGLCEQKCYHDGASCMDFLKAPLIVFFNI